jgi:YidC/Oxa1 family membrane protein insertase
MEKRLLVAIALSLLVLLSWSAFAPKPYHTDNQGVTSKIAPQDSKATTPSSLSAQPTLLQITPEVVPESPAIDFFQKEYDILFVESAAAIKEAIFKSYQDSHFLLQYGLLLRAPGLHFQNDSTARETISFRHRDPEKEVIKRFYFSNSSYSIELELEIRNLSNSPLKIAFPLIIGALDLSKDQAEARMTDITVSGRDNKITHLNLRKDIVIGDAKFLGIRDRYFCFVVEPDSEGYSGFIKKINAKEFEIGLTPEESILLPNERKIEKFSIYLGPQELKHINKVNPEWTAVMHYGTFNLIGHILLQILDFIFGLVHNWGTTIIILSILIYFMLYPLTMKQMHSMKKMQSLQPRIEELRKVYKDNPQKLNTEIMGLYREYKVNPLSGCLPMILQIPVFFALYQVLMRSAALKGAKFLWIKDLSAPDRLFTLPVSLPVLGNEVNLLPILMTIGMFIQQKFSMASGSTGSAEQQKLMMIIFPLMFGFIFYRMPSGLVLYWFVNSTLMLLYQLRINRSK